MSQIIQIQDINSSDTIKTMVEKINYNFDQIMAFGGGPQGEKGDKGELGPDGEQGERGNLITVVDDISTVGSDLKVGDIAIYSDDQYIYKVKENSDGNLFFEKTSIYIKGNNGERGESGTSNSPFKYYDEIHDAIITADYDGKIPSHTFIGTNTIVSNGLGVLNIVGNENANGIYLFTGDSDSNYYCGKIYGDKLGSENILVLQGEDNDDNYVKIDDTLLTDKIHSSNNIKIAEVIDDRIVLGDSSNKASIDCNEFTVKNGRNTPIKTSSSKINLEGNLYVNDNNYTYTTKICGSSVDINSDSIYVSLPRMSSRPIPFVSSQANIYARKNNISLSVIDGLIQSSIEITSEKIKIDADKVIIGKNSQSNTQINGDVTAKVNGVPDVYLGCPIGTVVMWAGGEDDELPYGWLLCNGDEIKIINADANDYDFKFTYQTNTIYKKAANDDMRNLTKVIYSTFYSRTNSTTWHVYLPNLQQRFPLGALSGGRIGKNSSGNGWSTNLGTGSKYNAGEATHTLTMDEISHTHHVQISTMADGSIESGTHMGTAIDTVDSGPNPIIDHNNIPPFVAINFIIKYK